VLLTALNTLVIDDRVVPLLSILAQAAIESADAQRQNKDKGLALLQTAQSETNRSPASWIHERRFGIQGAG
jgi:hypothetical protein